MVRSAIPLLGGKGKRTGSRSGEGRAERRVLQNMAISSSVVCLEMYSLSNCLLNSTLAETFWVDLVVRNPLDAELNLVNLTLVVRDVNGSQPEDQSDPLVDVEVVEDVVLAPRESRIVSPFFHIFSQ